MRTIPRFGGLLAGLILSCANACGGSGANSDASAGAHADAGADGMVQNFPPKITDITPLIGSVGDTAIITGDNLYYCLPDHPGRVVAFTGPNGTAVPATNCFLGTGVGSFGVVVPDGAVNGPITITNTEDAVGGLGSTFKGTSTFDMTFHVNYKAVVTSMTPSSGPGGTLVTFKGSHFENLDPNAGLSLFSTGDVSTLSTASNFPVTVIDGANATATMPAFKTNGSSGMRCGIDVYLDDISAGTNGENSGAAGTFTVTGLAPECP